VAELDKVILEGIHDGRRAFKGPKVVQIDLTGACNNDCIGCWVHSAYIKNPPRDKNVTLDFKKVQELIESLSLLDTEEIFLSGAGEPFMHPNILEIVELIKRKGFRLNIITNATLLDKKRAEKIVDLGVELITASIWAGTANGYIKTHPSKTKEDFSKIQENLRAIASLKEERGKYFPRIKIYDVICNQNYDQICQMVDFALSSKVEFVEFQIMDLDENDTAFLALSPPHIESIKNQFDHLLEHDKLYFHQELEHYNLICKNFPDLKEFSGRFLMLPEGFSILETDQIKKSEDGRCGKEISEHIMCPRGASAGLSSTNSGCDEENNIFYFSFPADQCATRNCRDCRFDEQGQLLVKFLRIFSYGSFMRRINSANIYGNSYDNELIDNIPCYVGWTYTRVLSTGEVIPCCKSANKPLGDINSHNFSDIWNSKLYQEFRKKAKLSPKSDPYFREINCRKACDNAGMNLQIHQQIMKKEKLSPENQLLAPGLSRQAKPGLPKAKGKIIVAAAGFNRGNLNATHHQFGEGMVIDGGCGYAWAEYDIVFEEAGKYELWSRYAAHESRPIELYFDGELITSNALNGVTEGWKRENIKWFAETSWDINAGKHTLKIFIKSIIPHIHSFAFIKDISRDTKGEIIYPSEEIFSQLAPLGLLKDKIKKSGLVCTTAKLFDYVKSGRFLHSYLDLLGIYNGEYAFGGPSHVQIDLTYNCNNNCIGCWCNSPLLEEKTISPRTKAETLPFDLITELLDQLAKMGTKEIYFSGGGEPFVHPRIMEILEYAKSRKFVCYVNTNFTLLDKEKIKRLIDVGVEHLTVSTWAATAKTYALTHPNKNEDTFRQIIENLKFLNDAKIKTPYIKLYNVIFNLNYHEIKDMVRLAQETRSESVEFTLIDTIPGKTDKLLLDSHQINELQKYAQEISSSLDKNCCFDGVLLFRFDSFLRRIASSSDLKKATYDRNIIDRIPCYIGWSFARVMPNGDVNACLKAHRIPTGNLYRDSFNQIWNGEKQRHFRKKTLVYEKKDPFFQLIGNDPHIKEAGCYKSCDDIGRNTHIHNRIMSLTFLERQLLKAAARIKQRPKLNSEPRARSQDPVLDGIQNGRNALIGPEQVVIDLTNRCNQQCIGCWLYSPLLKQKPKKECLTQEISFEKARDLISSLAELGTKRIRFTGGGEPFMHPEIMKLVEHTKSKGLFCCITTNFSLLNKEKVKDLIKLRVDELAISLWASHQDTYQKTHPGSLPGTFEKIKENLKTLTEEKINKPMVTLCNVICNLNYLEVEDMFKFALAMKTDGIYFTLVDTLEGTESLLLSKEQRRIVLRQVEAIKKHWAKMPQDSRIRLDYFDGFISRLNEEASSLGNYDRERVDKIPCYVGWIFARVLADGGITPCCRGVNKLMGNINNHSFKDIWLSGQYAEFRTKARYLPKTDPYFSEIGCLKMCDNMMHNEELHNRIVG